MKVLLVNVDAKFNIAIRKLYRYYKESRPDCEKVEMIDLNFSAYPHKKHKVIDALGYDITYVSNLFEINADRVKVKGGGNVHWGGIGSKNPTAKLIPGIENLQPWYFPEETESRGFITRGCIRNCWFCKVPKHEGKLYLYNNVEDIVQHKKAIFMDNNILAYEKHTEVLQWLIDNKIACEFNQGLDFRLVTEENAKLLSQLKYIGPYTFAFDDPSYLPGLNKALPILKRYIQKPWKLRFFVYFHPKMSIEGLLMRINWCIENEALPYVMRDQACYSSELNNFCTDIAAWCNQPALLKNLTFEEFLYKRHTNKERIANSLAIYKKGLENGQFKI